MTVVGQIRKGAYFDSVSLMQCGKAVAGMAGIVDAAVAMGTRSNRAILESAGLLLEQFRESGDTDLLIAVKAETEAAAETALAAVDGILRRKRSSGGGELRPWSMEGALQALPGANLALISVAGRYAGNEALRALEHGLHVMLFSDNVSLEQEIELKQCARGKGLLMMGPDCGSAIINGVPLGFANAVRRGDIGMVAAAGTGLQEVTCIISNAGAGISQAIGTGGRDVKREVGGIMLLEGLKALAGDDATKVIVVVSKPPHPEVLEKIQSLITTIAKPVIAIFVGASGKDQPSSLEQAALTAVAVARGEGRARVVEQLAAREQQIAEQAARLAIKRKPGQRYVRGLFSGGTFCAEAQVLFSGMLEDVYSNAPAGRGLRLEDALRSRGNTVIDLGEDEFTVGRPHPMIDYSLRNRRIRHEAADPQTAVVLLDVVLGYGANPDPAAELSAVLREAVQQVAVVCSITGTDQDPQNRSAVQTRLEADGAIVMPSNAAACKLAAYMVQARGGKCVAQTV